MPSSAAALGGGRHRRGGAIGQQVPGQRRAGTDPGHRGQVRRTAAARRGRVRLGGAYREYIRDEAVPDGLKLYRDRPNVAVLRTFSKAYGLAGLRTGFLVAHEPVAAAVRMTMLPFSVNSIAQAAAVASLAAEDELLERVELTV